MPDNLSTPEGRERYHLTFIAQQGYEDGYQYDWNPEGLKGKEYQQYKRSWKRGLSQYLTGMEINASEMIVPVTRGTGSWRLQVGKGRGTYEDRCTSESQIEATRHYDSINIGNGYKKRLIDPNGVLVYTQLS